MDCYIEGISVPADFNHQRSHSSIPGHMVVCTPAGGTASRLVSIQGLHWTFSCSLTLEVSDDEHVVLGLDWYSYFREALAANKQLALPPRQFSLQIALHALRNNFGPIAAPWKIYEFQDTVILADCSLQSYIMDNNPLKLHQIQVAPENQRYASSSKQASYLTSYNNKAKDSFQSSDDSIQRHTSSPPLAANSSSRRRNKRRRQKGLQVP